MILIMTRKGELFMEIIKVENIYKSFSQKKVLTDISIQIQSGEIFGLLGPSGAGKTTLINIITGQLEADSGQSYVMQKNSLQLSKEDYTHIGLVLDKPGLYDRLTCYDNLLLYASIYHLDHHKIDDVLKHVHLYNDKKTIVNQLSKGMKQRLVIARAIMHEPQILFLDEPTSGLDPATSLKIHELLLQLKKKGTAIFLTTHNMEEASLLCDKVALLNEGQIIEYDRPENICSRYNHLNKMVIMTKDNQEHIIENKKENAQFVYDLIALEQIKSIHSSEPTLGNVFITLTGKELV